VKTTTEKIPISHFASLSFFEIDACNIVLYLNNKINHLFFCADAYTPQKIISLK
jgi:hypothetical protein